MQPFSLNIRGRLLDYSQPLVMGIINVTPDSFYSRSRTEASDDITRVAQQMIADGADIIDIGAYSTRPGHGEVSEEEELRRLSAGLSAVRSISEDIPVSVDTFRPSVAAKAIEYLGADIINDISGGCDEMYDVVASLKAPYILTNNLSCNENRSDIIADVLGDLGKRLSALKLKGVNDIIIDPGFGFGKSLSENYRLLNNLDALSCFNLPILAGLSRKSMATKLLGIDAVDALAATVALNTLALVKCASILRVHDVAAARHTVEIYRYTLSS